MSEESPSIMSQAPVGTNDFVWACAFYVTVIGTISSQRIMGHGEAITYGKAFPGSRSRRRSIASP